jgi:predicted DNA-binding protein
VPVDWTYRADYIRRRHDIAVEWAEEALADPDALRVAHRAGPGKQVRPECSDDRVLASVRRAGHSDHRRRGWRRLWRERVEVERNRHSALWRGVEVNEIEKLIEEESEASEANRDAPLSAGARRTRPNHARSTVYSVRLAPDEVAAIEQVAERAGLPASTVVRSWIVAHLREELEEVGDAESELRAVRRHLAHLERHIGREAS